MSDQDTGARRPDGALDVRHDTFTLSRRLDAPPSTVFAAFADTALRRRWFRLPGSGATYEHTFGVGGGETAHSTFALPDAVPERLEYRSRYIDVVPDRRIVFVYESTVDDIRRWTSLVTVLLDGDAEPGDTESGDAEGVAGSTELTWTEQAAFLTRTGDGSADLPHLRGATSLRLNALTVALRSATNPIPVSSPVQSGRR